MLSSDTTSIACNSHHSRPLFLPVVLSSLCCTDYTVAGKITSLHRLMAVNSIQFDGGVISEKTLCSIQLSLFMSPIRDRCADCVVTGEVVNFIIRKLNAVNCVWPNFEGTM